MSRKRGKGPNLELGLNVAREGPPSPKSGSGSSSSSLLSSCVSDEPVQSSPKCGSKMVLTTCPWCLMYIFIPEEEPECPKCKRTVPPDSGICGGGSDKEGKS